MHIRTNEEVTALKSQWKDDPLWDIEDTEGFEEHREELVEFRLECEAEWSASRAAAAKRREIELTKLAEALGVPGNVKLAEYISPLRRRVEDLEEKLKCETSLPG